MVGKFVLVWFAIFAVACGGNDFRGEEEEELGTSAEALSVPKGQIAVASATPTSSPVVFVSWGWLYWSSEIHTFGTLELLRKTSSPPKALASVYTSGHTPWVVWIEGSQVKALSRNPLRGWNEVSTLSSTSLFGGTLTRIVGTEGPALVGLTSNGKVVTNWFRDGAWAGWCVSKEYGNIIPEGADIAAYKHNNGILAYAVNSIRNGETQLEVAFIHRECFADNPLRLDTPSIDPTARLSADGISDRVPLFPVVFSVNADGLLRNATGGVFSQPAPFRSFVHRARLFENQIYDRFYAIDVDGNAWRTQDTLRLGPFEPVDRNPEWVLLE